MNKGKNSRITCINIIYNETDNTALINTQLDDEITLKILENCVKKLQVKTSQEKVPIGKDR